MTAARPKREDVTLTAVLDASERLVWEASALPSRALGGAALALALGRVARNVADLDQLIALARLAAAGDGDAVVAALREGG